MAACSATLIMNIKITVEGILARLAIPQFASAFAVSERSAAQNRQNSNSTHGRRAGDWCN
jgi:hypothetical protein